MATKRYFAIIFLMILTLGISLALPAEDIPETVYDESEAPPYEDSPLFSIPVPLVEFRSVQSGLTCVSFYVGSLPRSAECRLSNGTGLCLHPDSSTIFDCSLRC